jgi:hypothetical protein
LSTKAWRCRYCSRCFSLPSALNKNASRNVPLDYLALLVRAFGGQAAAPGFEQRSTLTQPLTAVRWKC